MSFKYNLEHLQNPLFGIWKIKGLPAERRKNRNNIEATMKEFTKGFYHKGINHA